VPPEHRGTYLGVIDRIGDLVDSGATGVVLSNVFLSSLTAAPPPEPEGPDGAAAPREPWPSGGGALRRPLSFFAPEVAMAAGGDAGGAAGQLKALVAALHGAGLEVLLEVRARGGGCLGGGVPGGCLGLPQADPDLGFWGAEG
jgi:isoamylase